MELSRRYVLNCCPEEALTPEELAQGYHYCPDWDYLLVGPDDYEKEGCTCAIIKDG